MKASLMDDPWLLLLFLEEEEPLDPWLLKLLLFDDPE